MSDLVTLSEGEIVDAPRPGCPFCRPLRPRMLAEWSNYYACHALSRKCVIIAPFEHIEEFLLLPAPDEAMRAVAVMVRQLHLRDWQLHLDQGRLASPRHCHWKIVTDHAI